MLKSNNHYRQGRFSDSVCRGPYTFSMQEPFAKTVARRLLGSALVFAGVSHLSFARRPFQAQVPDWVPHEFISTTRTVLGIILAMSEGFSAPIAKVLAHIEEFTEEELLHLNRLIVERLRLMQQVRAHRAMTQFRVGQRVQFGSNNGQPITGVLTKYNRKSVTVVTDQGASWTVSPSLLQAVK